MSQSQRLSDLEELLRSTVQGFELELDSVVRANQSGTPVIRVTVDAPIGIDGIDSDALADVSRAVSKILDASTRRRGSTCWRCPPPALSGS